MNTQHTPARTSAVRRSAAAVAALGLVATLAACGADADAATGGDEAASLSIADTWVKATDEGMTAAFGVVTNDSDEDVTIVSATTDASPTAELHTMTMGDDGSMTMVEKDGGFVVPSGGTLAFEPGGDHIMIMGVTEPILPGDDVEVTLTLDDGSTLDFAAAGRTYTGANETYGEDDTEHAGHDMGDMDMSTDGATDAGDDH
ncbi:hypothetical protein CLV28_1279 [Sediminihabitans luteus]|uniref:Copper(I)-binding protein n=1 Tax=Sediminihabitans luteus TaxID=1138585 RepID=A0A2M9CPK1_9CELL|nr:copper chaperone PCu(A)C [Sediminihabitans luteus]PJJ73798.1 hypothetical protein CLV28_1279 [Sediminihabitans luteus]GIJ00474.1 hypothetical protein Slu03_28510 [Sediminihabitans luteus]